MRHIHIGEIGLDPGPYLTVAALPVPGDSSSIKTVHSGMIAEGEMREGRGRNNDEAMIKNVIDHSLRCDDDASDPSLMDPGDPLSFREHWLQYRANFGDLVASVLSSGTEYTVDRLGVCLPGRAVNRDWDDLTSAVEFCYQGKYCFKVKNDAGVDWCVFNINKVVPVLRVEAALYWCRRHSVAYQHIGDRVMAVLDLQGSKMELTAVSPDTQDYQRLGVWDVGVHADWRRMEGSQVYLESVRRLLLSQEVQGMLSACGALLVTGAGGLAMLDDSENILRKIGIDYWVDPGDPLSVNALGSRLYAEKINSVVG